MITGSAGSSIKLMDWANVCYDLSRSLKPHLPCKCEIGKGKSHTHLDQEVFSYGAKPLCVSGGYGSAKTFAVCRKMLWFLDTFPNNRIVIARKIWLELEKTSMSTFFKICPPSAYSKGRRSDVGKSLVLNNGSEILWMHLDDPDIDGIIRGLEINGFILEQAEEISESVFDALLGRLGRWDKAEVPAHAIDEAGGITKWKWKNPQGKPIVPTFPIITCNPDHELHWIYRRFHPESPDHSANIVPVLDLNTGQETGQLTSYKNLGYRMISMNSLENRFLPVQNRQYLLSQSDDYQRRFVRGEWGIPEGQIHDISKLSLIPGTIEIVKYLLQSCTLHRTLDWGDASPTCCLWEAVDKSGNVFLFMEYYHPNRLISDQRKDINNYHEFLKGICKRDFTYIMELADPSIFYKTMQKYGGRWSVADEYTDTIHLPKDNALYWQPADNDEYGTRNRINEYLRVDTERVHPFSQTKGSPRLFFITKSTEWPYGCYYAVQETRAQRRKRIGTNLGKAVFSDERDESIPDHGYDPVKYFMASRSPAATVLAIKPSQKSFVSVREQYLRDKRSGRFAFLARKAAAQSRIINA